jgi:hypothetical protein
MISRPLILAATLVACATIAVFAQGRQRASPHETVSATIDGAAISIEYGRPYMKGRQVEGGLIPYGKVWRTGADEATTLTTDKTLEFEGLTVPAGKYTLYTQASEGDWKLIVNKQTGQWGTVYDEKQDLGRVALTKTALPTPVEQFTIAIDQTSGGGGAIKLRWNKTEAAASFKVKG